MFWALGFVQSRHFPSLCRYGCKGGRESKMARRPAAAAQEKAGPSQRARHRGKCKQRPHTLGALLAMPRCSNIHSAPLALPEANAANRMRERCPGRHKQEENPQNIWPVLPPVDAAGAGPALLWPGFFVPRHTFIVGVGQGKGVELPYLLESGGGGGGIALGRVKLRSFLRV